MDPDFAAVFSSEYPEAYGEFLRNQRGGAGRSLSDAVAAIRVPVVPPLLTRLTAGVAMLFLLIGGYFAVSGSVSNGAGSSSGEQLSSNAGLSLQSGSSQGLSELAGKGAEFKEKMVPIGMSGKKLLRTWGE